MTNYERTHNVAAYLKLFHWHSLHYVTCLSDRMPPACRTELVQHYSAHTSSVSLSFMVTEDLSVLHSPKVPSCFSLFSSLMPGQPIADWKVIVNLVNYLLTYLYSEIELDMCLLEFTNTNTIIIGIWKNSSRCRMFGFRCLIWYVRWIISSLASASSIGFKSNSWACARGLCNCSECCRTTLLIERRPAIITWHASTDFKRKFWANRLTDSSNFIDHS